MRSLIQRDVLRACAAKCRGWMVLVLDAEAARVLTPVLGMYDLMEERVTLVESLEKRRQPFPEMDVIYVSAARDTSVRAICADWRGRSEAPYADAHVFFLNALDDDQLGQLGATPELTPRLQTLSELRMDFLALEAQCFDLGVGGAFGVWPNCAAAELSAEDRRVAYASACEQNTHRQSAYQYENKNRLTSNAASLASRNAPGKRSGW